MPPGEDEDEAETRDTLTQFEDFVTHSIEEHLDPPEVDDVDPAAG